MIAKKTILIFHSALAPYRIDFFNEISKAFNATIVFLSDNLRNQKFDNQKLIARTNFDAQYLNKKIVLADRDINFGYLSYLNKIQPDLVISGEFGLSVLIPYFFNFLIKKKYKIITICDDSLEIAKNCSGLRKILRNFLITKLDGMILVNSDVGNWYSRNFILKSEPLIFPILQNEKIFREQLEESLPISELYIQKWNLTGKKILLYVGRLTEVKGLDRLLEAFAKAEISQDNCMIIVGDGELKENLIGLSNTLKISDKVFFVGRYEGVDLLAWYNIGSVFVLPSHYEPFGAVVNEALLSGCQVICSSKAGASTLIRKGENGNVYDPYDIKSLVSLISLNMKGILGLTEKIQVKKSLMIDSFDKNIISLVSYLKEK